MILGIGIDDATHLGVKGSADEYRISLLGIGKRHHNSLSSSRSTIIHRGIANIHARQFSHHRLIFKDVVQRTLRDLCLIGCVAGQKLRALDDVLHHRGSIMVVDACTSKDGQRTTDSIVRHRVEQVTNLHLAQCFRQVILPTKTDGFRNVGI